MTTSRDYHFKEIVSFRFRELTKEQSDSLKEEVSESKCTEHFEKPCFVGAVALNENMFVLKFISLLLVKHDYYG